MENVKVVIISDGKMGHLNQSVALCQIKGWDYDIVKVEFKSKRFKALSYFFDFVGFYTDKLFSLDKNIQKATIIVCTGSSTYYPAKVVSKKLGSKTIAIMLPKGYKLDFDYVIAQSHDNPSRKSNIVELPINLAASSSILDESEMKKRFVFKKDVDYVGVIIGGPNGTFSMKIDDLLNLFNHLKELPKTKIVATTSRRTPKEIEEWLESLDLEYLLIYSKDNFNPIPYFLNNCKNIIITSDSTSMISEAVANGNSAVDALMLPSKDKSKFHKLIEKLSTLKLLHIFDGTLGQEKNKIDIADYLKAINLTQDNK